jgi:hypothetical protein
LVVFIFIPSEYFGIVFVELLKKETAMKYIKLFLIPAILFIGCQSKKGGQNSDDIAGTYVMEKTYEVRHEATGEPVGMATLRDTIIITKISDGYEVKNRKWKKNQFDEEGWVKQEHDSSPDYKAILEESTQTLRSEPAGLFSSLIFKSTERRLIKSSGKGEYSKL